MFVRHDECLTNIHYDEVRNLALNATTMSYLFDVHSQVGVDVSRAVFSTATRDDPVVVVQALGFVQKALTLNLLDQQLSDRLPAIAQVGYDDNNVIII